MKKRDPYCFKNFKHALSMVDGYVDCMKKCGVNWLGLKFKFPLIWWPTRPYRDDFSLTKAKEKQCWKYWVAHNGYLDGKEPPELSYNFSSLHERGTVPALDSDQWRLLHEDMQQSSWGEMLGPKIPLFNHILYTLFVLSYSIFSHQTNILSSLEP